MTYVDFHTHHSSANGGEKAIINGKDTWGIHPWTLAVNGSTQPDDSTLAIGECGLDKLCGTPFLLQKEAFVRCIDLSERLGKPLVLHCVRSIDDCLALRKQLQASQPWIWHGYRGNATQLRKLLPMGFYFSFGFRHRTETLISCPKDHLLLESDDDPHPVSLLYTSVSETIGISIEELSAQMVRNYRKLFG